MSIIKYLKSINKLEEYLRLITVNEIQITKINKELIKVFFPDNYCSESELKKKSLNKFDVSCALKFRNEFIIFDFNFPSKISSNKYLDKCLMNYLEKLYHKFSPLEKKTLRIVTYIPQNIFENIQEIFKMNKNNQK